MKNNLFIAVSKDIFLITTSLSYEKDDDYTLICFHKVQDINKIKLIAQKKLYGIYKTRFLQNKQKEKK